MKLQLIGSLSLLLGLAACSNNQEAAPAAAKEAAAATPSQAQKNLDAFHVIDKAFQTGDVSGVDAVVAADFVDHTEKGDMGRDSLKAMIKMMAKDTSMKMTTTKEVADDDYVFSQGTYTGMGDGKSMPAGRYEIHAVEVVKFKDGKATEHWGYMEGRDVAKMMQPPAKKK